MGDTEAKKDLRAKVSETADKAVALYKEWGAARLKGSIRKLDHLHNALEQGRLWDSEEEALTDDILRDINEMHEKVTKILRERQGRAETEIEKIMAALPSSADTEHSQRSWLAVATRLAFAVERLESHVMRKNPHPFILSTEYHDRFWKRMRKGGMDDREIDELFHAKVHAFQTKYETDRRPKRSPEEQAWLKEEDTLYRLQRRLNRKIKQKEHAKSKPRKAKQQHPGKQQHQPKHHTPKAAEHKPRHMPGPKASGGGQIPAFPERRAAQAIAPYQRPRVASRLPAFPAFPQYPRA